MKRPIPNISEAEEFCMPRCDPPLRCIYCSWIATITDGDQPVFRPSMLSWHPGVEAHRWHTKCPWCLNFIKEAKAGVDRPPPAV